LSEKQLLGIAMVNILFTVADLSPETYKIKPALLELRKRNTQDIGKKIMEKIDCALFDTSLNYSIWNKYPLETKKIFRKKSINLLRSIMYQIISQEQQNIPNIPNMQETQEIDLSNNP
jgi:hypothetical protein